MVISLGYIRGPVANHQDFTIFSEVHKQSAGSVNVACCTTSEKAQMNNWDPGKIRYRRYAEVAELFSDEFDVLDVSEFYRDYSLSVLKDFVGKKSVTVFDNLPHGISGGSAGKLSDMADVVIARTPMIRNMLELEGVSRSKIHVVPSATNISIFKPGIFTNNNPVVLFVGRLVPEKGLWDLIVAMTGMTAELHVAGPGDISPYELLAKECKVDMKYHGALAHDQLPSFLRTGSLLVVPSIPKIDVYNPENSWVEQFGMIIIEGMATGLPVIASDTGSARDIIIDAQSGCLFPARGWDHLRELIKQFLGSSSLRNQIGGRARERVQKTFSTQVVGNALAQIYLSL